jgi:hypothetical protein
VNIKRILGFVLLGTACIVFGFMVAEMRTETQEYGPDVPYWYKGLRKTGTLMSIEQGVAHVKVAGGMAMSFKIDPLTQIVVWPPSTGLTPGDEVTVVYKQTNEVNIARLIRQTRKPGSPASPSAVH